MSKLHLIVERQAWHLLALLALLYGLFLAGGLEGFYAGELWGISTAAWFSLTIATAIAHQVEVWLCWRAQLHASLMTRMFGRHDFTVHAVAFALLGILRIALVVVLAASNRQTIGASPRILHLLAILLAVPAAYLFYSVARYFGFKRAFGVDHFDASYRSKPFVALGIFRFSSNAMYVFGFLAFWIPGLLQASLAAIVAALFNHLYIWVHYYCTEKPDIRRIHG